MNTHTKNPNPFPEAAMQRWKITDPRVLSIGLLVVAALMMALTVTLPSVAQAGSIELLNRGKGVPNHVQPQTKAMREAQVRRLTGDLQYRRNEGLQLRGTDVRIDHLTTFFPDTGQRSRVPDASEFGGRRVTVFGRMMGNTLHASLVIFERSVQAGSSNSRIDLRLDKVPNAQAERIPSGSDPNVGELAPSVPD